MGLGEDGNHDGGDVGEGVDRHSEGLTDSQSRDDNEEEKD